jgi:hypothetical protein
MSLDNAYYTDVYIHAASGNHFVEDEDGVVWNVHAVGSLASLKIQVPGGYVHYGRVIDWYFEEPNKSLAVRVKNILIDIRLDRAIAHRAPGLTAWIKTKS